MLTGLFKDIHAAKTDGEGESEDTGNAMNNQGLAYYYNI